jgi:hypothetical protein
VLVVVLCSVFFIALAPDGRVSSTVLVLGARLRRS